MKIKSSNNRFIRVVIAVVILIVVALLLFLLTSNLGQSSYSTNTDSNQGTETNTNHGESVDNQVIDEPENSDLELEQDDNRSSDRVNISYHTHVNPPDIEIEPSVNRLSYRVAFTDNDNSGTTCKITASNGESTLSAQSTVSGRECNGQITDSNLSPGSEWTVTLIYTDRDNHETVTRKALQIQ